MVNEDLESQGMSRKFVSSIKCPFFKRFCSTKHTISCEGLCDNSSSTVLQFTSYNNATNHIINSCVFEYTGDKCPLAEMLYKKYDY